MKNKYLLVIIIVILGFCVRVSAKTNYFSAAEQANNYIRNFNGYDRYIITQNTDYGFENGNIVENNLYTNGGLLNKDEFIYSKNAYGESYLNNGLEYFTMTNVDSGSVYVIKPDEVSYLTGKTMTQNSGVRVTNYIQSDVNVSGSGSKSDPWVFIDKYYIRLDYDDTRLNVSPSTFVVPGNGAIVSTVTPKSNSIFNGNSCGGEYNTSTNKFILTNIKSDIVCTLFSYPGSYIITYNSNGGNNCNPTYKSVTPGSAIETMCEPSRIGYSFIGWFDEAENGVQISTDIVPEHDMEIFAHWNQDDYVITYNSNGGQACNPGYKTITPGQTVGTMCSPERDGHGFIGWYTESEGGSQITSDMIIDHDIELFAHWNASSLTVTYNCNGGSGVAPASINALYGSNASVTDKPCGYKIVTGTGTGTSASPNVYYQTGWATSSNGSATSPITITENTILYATWGKLFTYSANYEVVNDGSGNWKVKFLSNGDLVMNESIDVDIFAVGGGGSGSSSKVYGGGGGGAGGYTYTLKGQPLSTTTYAVTIGAGGAAKSTYNTAGSTGGTTTFGSLVSALGGSGGGTAPTWRVGGAGGSGGSGGGGGRYGSSDENENVSAGNGGSNGGAGGRSTTEGNYNAAGGTGCATNSGCKVKVYGGSETTCTNTRAFCESSETAYAGGGGGGAAFLQCGYGWDCNSSFTFYGGSGGSLGGGAGKTITVSGYPSNGGNNTTASSGSPNTGGGGGGAAAVSEESNTATSGSGGSGIVIIRNHR